MLSIFHVPGPERNFTETRDSASRVSHRFANLKLRVKADPVKMKVLVGYQLLNLLNPLKPLWLAIFKNVQASGSGVDIRFVQLHDERN
jgi:hypothetical protein